MTKPITPTIVAGSPSAPACTGTDAAIITAAPAGPTIRNHRGTRPDPTAARENPARARPSAILLNATLVLRE